MQIATWKKPGTDEMRIYFNDVFSTFTAFAVETDDDQFEIKFSSYFGGLRRDQKDEALDILGNLLEEMSGERVTNFSQLLKLAK
jgi:hypothetical protein